MSQSKPEIILKNLIDKEAERISACPDAEKRVALFELIRAMDSYFLYSFSLPNEKKFNEWNESEENCFKEFGINTALSLFIGKHCYNRGYLLMILQVMVTPHGAEVQALQLGNSGLEHTHGQEGSRVISQI